MPLPTSLGFMLQPFWRSPEMVGAARHIIIGKHTGSKALKYITQRMGYYLKDEELVNLSERVKMCSEFKHAINCEELRKLRLFIRGLSLMFYLYFLYNFSSLLRRG